MKIPSIKLLPFLAAAVLMFAAATGHAQSLPAPRLNRDYVRVAPPQPTPAGDKIEVIEFFYYGCPVCYELEPMVSRWSVEIPKDIEFRRIPALTTPNWENFARLYYTLEAFGEVKRLNWPVYEGIHFDETILNREAEIVKWASGQSFLIQV